MRFGVVLRGSLGCGGGAALSQRHPRNPPAAERLQKVIAAAGVASRRAAEQLILAGRVSVDGRVVRELGTRVTPRQAVAVDGKPLARGAARLELMVHKPRGMLSVLADPQGRPALGELLGAEHRGRTRLLPVGRLDYQAEGLFLLSSDAELARQLVRPDCPVPSTFLVRVQGAPSPDSLRALRAGVALEDGPAALLEAEVQRRNASSTWLTVTLVDGRPRLLARLFARLGHTLLRSQRIAYAGLELGRLRARETRELSAAEAATLRGWGPAAPGDGG